MLRLGAALLAAIYVVPLLLIVLVSPLVDANWYAVFLLGASFVLTAILLRWLLLTKLAKGTKNGAVALAAPGEEIAVTSFGSYPEAGLAAERLRRAGIRSVLVPNRSGPYPLGPAEGYELRVLGKDIRQVQELLGLVPSRRRTYRKR